MRRIVEFVCAGVTLVGTLDPASGPSPDNAGETGLLIVSGGNELRWGAHRGMAVLAAALAARGHHVFRFDRRGVGDSEGDNGGFLSSAPDIDAALAAFRTAVPSLRRVVAFGNCDAAAALALHDTPVDARVLANPYVVAPVDALPPPAAIKARYVERVRDPAAWRALLTGQIDLKLLARGLGRLATLRPLGSDSLADRVVGAIEDSAIPSTLILATRDATAIAFTAVWRNDARIPVVRLDSASHSFATDDDFQALVATLDAVLAG